MSGPETILPRVTVARELSQTSLVQRSQYSDQICLKSNKFSFFLPNPGPCSKAVKSSFKEQFFFLEVSNKVKTFRHNFSNTVHNCPCLERFIVLATCQINLNKRNFYFWLQIDNTHFHLFLKKLKFASSNLP
jgi:hypothetical protein